MPNADTRLLPIAGNLGTVPVIGNLGKATSSDEDLRTARGVGVPAVKEGGEETGIYSVTDEGECG